MPFYEEPTPELEAQHQELGYYPKPDDFEPNPTFPEGDKRHGLTRCAAWNTAKGRQCMVIAKTSRGLDSRGKPFNKCIGHGGKTPRGVESANFIHGRYSAYMPQRLMEKYDALMNDAELMDLRSRAELLELRIVEIVENLDQKGSFTIFRELQEKWDVYDKYMNLSRGASTDRRREYQTRAAEA